MQKIILFLILSCVITMPVYAQHDDSCVSDVNQTPPKLAEDWFTNDAWDQVLTTWTSAYLNTGAPVDAIPSYIDQIEESTPDLIFSSTYVMDVTHDASEDIIVRTVLSWGGGYNFHLGVYGCADDSYHLLDEIQAYHEGHDATVELIADTNNNLLPEIIIRYQQIPRKFYESYVFYEWQEDHFESIFSTEWQYGGYGPVFLRNYDDDPTTMELIIGRIYSYGESSADAYIELWLHRSINQVYVWTGDSYELFCEYFDDKPDVLFQVVHSAEALRQCGNLYGAVALYQQIVNDYRAYYNGNPELESRSADNSLDLDRMGDETSTDIERDYTTAFAYYRLIQVYLFLDNTSQADSEINRMRDLFPIGKRGYRYAAMAETFYQEYTRSGDLEAACALAEQTFNTVRDTDADPLVPYQGNNIVSDEPIWIPPFYIEAGSAYSSDPDNLFMPDGMDGVIFIPVCL